MKYIYEVYIWKQLSDVLLLYIKENKFSNSLGTSLYTKKQSPCFTKGPGNIEFPAHLAVY